MFNISSFYEAKNRLLSRLKHRHNDVAIIRSMNSNAEIPMWLPKAYSPALAVVGTKVIALYNAKWFVGEIISIQPSDRKNPEPLNRVLGLVHEGGTECFETLLAEKTAMLDKAIDAAKEEAELKEEIALFDLSNEEISCFGIDLDLSESNK